MPAVRSNYSLASHNSFKLKVSTKYYVECQGIDDLMEFLGSGTYSRHPLLVMGEGSNILFTRDFPGTVLRPLFGSIEVTDESGSDVAIRAGAGINWDDLVEWTVARNYWGLENLSLIPGSAGAAPIQNIGAYGTEIREHIVTVEAVDLRTGSAKVFSNPDCRFSYRYSIFKEPSHKNYLVSHINLKLSKNPAPRLGYGNLRDELPVAGEPAVRDIRDAVIRIRQRKLPDPDKIGNAGSFFKNPVIPVAAFRELEAAWPGIPSYPAATGYRKVPAAWLIQQCGWKGKRVGNAGTYPEQALVIVNHGEATGKEILRFANRIEEDVRSRFGISLEKEVILI
jgi:UDP-N-acetylmuramate dehydrogenase